MAGLIHERCLNHPAREAVARCPGCRRYYCRECVTDHEGKVLCAGCLKKLTAAVPAHRRAVLAHVIRCAQLILGILTAWLFFYCLAQALLSIPTSFHEGAVWAKAGQE